MGDTWGGPETIGRNGAIVDELATSFGRPPGAIRRSICAGYEPLATLETQVEHIHRYAAAGVDTFIYNMAMPDAPAAIRRVGERLDELRGRFA